MLILKQDTPSVVMPVCYHPTTVLVVDDDASFINKLKASMSKNIALLCFDNPDAVINYIKNSRELQIPLASRLHFSGKNDTQTCGFGRMLEAQVQDIIHPYPKDIDLSFVKPIDAPIPSEGSPKPHETLEEFGCSQYILTEKSLYHHSVKPRRSGRGCKLALSRLNLVRSFLLLDVFSNDRNRGAATACGKIAGRP